MLLGHQKVTVGSQFAIHAAPELDEHNCAHPPDTVSPPPAPPLRIPVQLAPAPQRHLAVAVDAKDIERLGLLYQWPARRGVIGMAWPHAPGEVAGAGTRDARSGGSRLERAWSHVLSAGGESTSVAS